MPRLRAKPIDSPFSRGLTMNLRSILAVPAAYRFFQTLLRGNSRKNYVKEYIRPRPGDRVLDIGCGPGDFLSDMPEVDYLGIDISKPYIEAAKSRFCTRGRFVCTPLKDTVVDETHS